MKSVFDQSQTKKPHTERDLFLDGSVDIARYDTVRYKQFSELTDRQLGFFWRPEEVDVTKDAHDFKNHLTHQEKHMFISNLKRQILLDSVQGRGPVEAFLPYVSLPEAEFLTMAWGFMENIHSYSYTFVIRNVFSSPDEIFSGITDIEEIALCAKDISRDYDNLIEYGKYYDLLGEGRHAVNGRKVEVSKFELKRLIWRALNSVNALEGIRFYASFITSWLPAEHRKLMEGNAKIIGFICRDENLHLAATQMMLKTLPKDDPDFAKIQDEERDYVTKMFVDAVEQEKQWAKYLFSEGPVIGLNEEMLNRYLEYQANRRMSKIDLVCPYDAEKKNPLGWSEKWIQGTEVQPAPQETEITSYTISQVKQDVDDDTFSGMTL